MASWFKYKSYFLAASESMSSMEITFTMSIYTINSDITPDILHFWPNKVLIFISFTVIMNYSYQLWVFLFKERYFLFFRVGYNHKTNLIKDSNVIYPTRDYFFCLFAFMHEMPRKNIKASKCVEVFFFNVYISVD